MDVDKLPSQIARRVVKEARRLSDNLWDPEETDSRKEIGHLTDLREEHLTMVLASELRKDPRHWVTVEYPYNLIAPKLETDGWKRNRLDLYAWDGRPGSGAEVCIEVKLGGRRRTDLNTPGVFARNCLHDLRKLASIPRTPKRSCVFVGVWQCEEPGDQHRESPPDFDKAVKWVSRGWQKDDNPPRFLPYGPSEPEVFDALTKLVRAFDGSAQFAPSTAWTQTGALQTWVFVTRFRPPGSGAS